MSAQNPAFDVLVVGGGLAGLRAALAARTEGASVAITVKGKLGRSGCSAMTTAGYAAVLTDDSEDTVERHIADTRSGGGEVGDPELLRILCREAPESVLRLEGEGAAFARDESGSYVRSPSGDHSSSRVLTTLNNIGTDLTVPMAKLAVALGVEVLEYTMVTELLIATGRCVGVQALNVRTGATGEIPSTCVILATGGAGKLFSITSNPNDVTGDGFALAARAGAHMRDMEFIQFYPWRCIDPFGRSRVSIQPSTFVHGAKLFNSRGERFMLAFNPDGAEVTTRDVAARGIYEQMQRGLGIGGGVRLDLSPLDEETFRRSNPKVASLLESKGIDYRTYPFVVTPEAHFFMGGVEIDCEGATSIPGLYAAGEVAGGVHGANRINSNALPETQVWGVRAGRAAAALVASLSLGAPRRGALVRFGDSVAEGQDAAGRRAETRPVAGEEEMRGRLAELQERMWQYLGITRSETGLRSGLAFVSDRKSTLPARPATGSAARAWHELVSLYDTAELCLSAALQRTESRGAHFREDYPQAKDEWKVSLVLQKAGERFHSYRRPVTWADSPAAHT